MTTQAQQEELNNNEQVVNDHKFEHVDDNTNKEQVDDDNTIQTMSRSTTIININNVDQLIKAI